MPGFDGTGPRGQGPMTGWGAGYCGSRGFRRLGGVPGYGYGRGRGGRGRRNRYFGRLRLAPVRWPRGAFFR